MRLFLMVIMAAILSACMSTGTRVDQDKVSQFTKGKTTYDAVVQTLGKPDRTMVNSDGTKTIMYIYMHSQSKASNFIPFVGAFIGGEEMENSFATFTFDKRLVLTGYTSSQGGSNMNTGIINGRK